MLVAITVVSMALFGLTPLEAKKSADPPTRYPAVERLVAIGDLHGDLKTSRRVLKLVGAMDDEDRWIGGNLVIVQTGDQLDRGGDELEILDLLDSLREQAQAVGGDLHILNGNHELMNAKLDMRYVTVEGYLDFLDTPVEDPESASPQQVVDGVGNRIRAMRPGGTIALRFAERNVIVIVGDTAFVHGGILPHVIDYGIERLNRETRSWLRKEIAFPPPVLFPTEGPIWSRHFSDETDEEDCRLLREVLERLDIQRMVVAHTVQEEGITSACDQRVWRIDVGLATYYGGEPSALEIRDGKVKILTLPN